MRKSTTIAALSIILSATTACGNADDNKVTQTQMDDIDSVEGTISDDVLNTDESTEEAPIDASAVADGKSAAKKDSKGDVPADKKIDEPPVTQEPATADKSE